MFGKAEEFLNKSGKRKISKKMPKNRRSSALSEDLAGLKDGENIFTTRSTRLDQQHPIRLACHLPTSVSSRCTVSIRFYQSSSSSLACPVIWGRRFSWWSYSSMLPCLSCCPLSAPLLSCLSCMHLSILGLAVLFFFSPVSPHLTFFSLCAPLSFSSHGHHFSRFSVIFLDACTTPVVPLMCSFRILSLLVTPHIHLSILISFTSSRASCPLVVAQVSAPYNRAGLTTVL